MTNEGFELLVRKLERQAKEKPKLYRVKVLLMTGLGFGYISIFLILLLLLLGVSAALLMTGEVNYGTIKLLLFSGGLSFFIFKAMIVKMDMPQGYHLKKEDVPYLVNEIEELRTKLDTPQIHSIMVNHEFNAAVTQIPKYGLFGKKQNILIIGLPMMAGLSPEQFKYVLAHELAHISHSDTALGAKIYRTRMTWGRLLSSLEENEQFGTFLFRKFFKWYYPRYNAFTFAMARQQEYEADLAAAKAVSYEAGADELCRTSITAQYFYHDFYYELFEEYAEKNTVPHPYSELTKKFSLIAKEKAENYLEYDLQQESHVTDTHPCLKDRLHSIGKEARLPEASTTTALEAYLPDNEPILSHFNEAWVACNEEKWLSEMDQFNQDKIRLEELSSKELKSLDDMWEHAALTNKIKGPKKAAVIYEGIISSFPLDEKTSGIYLTLGNVYLHEEGKTERGIELIHQAIESDWECRKSGWDLLCGYYYTTGKKEEFEHAREHYEKWAQLHEESEEECSFVNVDNEFVTYERTQNENDVVINQLTNRPEIVEAYLVKRILKVIPERKNSLLALVITIPDGRDPDEYQQEMLQEYTENLTTLEHMNFIVLTETDELVEVLRGVDHSLVYTANVPVQVS